LNIYQTVYEGPDHGSVAMIFNNMAVVYEKLNEYEKALEYNQKALKIELVIDSNHPDVAESYNNIAIVYVKQGLYDLALEMREKALFIYNQVFESDHPDVIKTEISIGDIKKALVDDEKERKSSK
jgi:tetratricopeptide (TPR) repeat protein